MGRAGQASDRVKTSASALRRVGVGDGAGLENFLIRSPSLLPSSLKSTINHLQFQFLVNLMIALFCISHLKKQIFPFSHHPRTLRCDVCYRHHEAIVNFYNSQKSIGGMRMRTSETEHCFFTAVVKSNIMKHNWTAGHQFAMRELWQGKNYEFPPGQGQQL